MRVFLASALVILAIAMSGGNAQAQTKPAAKAADKPVATGTAAPEPEFKFVASILEFGVDPPSETFYWFPDLSGTGGPAAGWRDMPANSTKGPGEGFPGNLTVKCTVKAAKGKVTVTCPPEAVMKVLRGRVRGVLGMKTWVDADGKLNLGVTLYLESLSIPGHFYTPKVVKGAPENHTAEVVLQVEVSGTKEVTAEVEFSHAPVAK